MVPIKTRGFVPTPQPHANVDFKIRSRKRGVRGGEQPGTAQGRPAVDDCRDRVVGAVIADTDDLDRARHAIAVNERRRATNIDPVNGVAGLVQIDGDESAS